MLLTVSQAPIKYVQLATACLSNGEQLVFCDSEGTDLQYSWALNHQRLEDTALLSGHIHSKSIILKQHVSGWLVCNVRNHISDDKGGVDIDTCDLPLPVVTGTTPLAASGSAAVSPDPLYEAASSLLPTEGGRSVESQKDIATGTGSTDGENNRRETPERDREMEDAADNFLSEDPGFVFVNCSSNGTHISQWRPVNDTICDKPIYIPISSQIVVLISRNSCGAAIIVLMIGVVIFYTLKKTENKTHEVQPWQAGCGTLGSAPAAHHQSPLLLRSGLGRTPTQQSPRSHQP
ncbi:uncharacterized protein LOC130924158 isoform X2 [Corythoichthys intestinalis]|uniref:uncharacterized protein LOC130924158 isoform X2 n=1 Tax=Corythoichthys intestinalis TaxID=161448 RepID=UPI0025A57342|nr:uncharacterized protein LOC130924158 isoform X2 [Corythoichthys intestinalis]